MDDALSQLRLDAGFDDGKVKTCIAAAFDFAENYLWRGLRPQTIVSSYALDGCNYAELARAQNFSGLISVKYSAAGGEREIPILGVSVDDTLDVPRAYFPEPDASGDVFAPIKITYKTSAPRIVPEAIKQALLIAVAQFYDDRDSPDLSAASRILDIYKTRNFL